MPKPSSTSIAQDVLVALQQRGITSPMLEARLAYKDAAQLLNQHLVPMAGQDRVYPNLMNPQSSGRVGIARPPVGNFTADKKYGPHGIRDVVQPDEGMEWACFDWEAVEARVIGHACQDPVDTETFQRGWDIHTVTAIRMFGWPEPSFEPTKGNLWGTSDGLAYCERLAHLIDERDTHDHLVPYDESCRARRLAKNCRYALQYAVNEKAMARYAVEMKMSKQELWKFGRLYLASKPWLTRWKQRTWAECVRTHEARTAFGRRRKLVGDRLQVMKEGLNHQIQGTVADMMKLTITRVCEGVEGCLGKAFQTHDGCKFIFKRGTSPMAELKGIVERTWDLWGRPLFVPASWEVLVGHDA